MYENIVLIRLYFRKQGTTHWIIYRKISSVSQLTSHNWIITLICIQYIYVINQNDVYTFTY